MRSTELIEWNHPVHGRIAEHACAQHKTTVLLALRALGIGCSGQSAPYGTPCDRCDRAGLPVASWISDFTQVAA